MVTAAAATKLRREANGSSAPEDEVNGSVMISSLGAIPAHWTPAQPSACDRRAEYRPNHNTVRAPPWLHLPGVSPVVTLACRVSRLPRIEPREVIEMNRMFAMAMALLFAGSAAIWHAQDASGQMSPDDPNATWTKLFDGKTLDGWTPLGDANWRIEDGVIVADKASAISYLVSSQTWADFELKAEIWVDADANSGIFIRATDPKKINSKTGYEVNVFDKRPDPTYATGSIVDVAKSSTVVTAANKWNTLDILATNLRFDVTFNDTKTVDGASDQRFPSGYIALQYGKGVVKFRNVQIKKL
jgi:hypothetical protein